MCHRVCGQVRGAQEKRGSGEQERGREGKREQREAYERDREREREREGGGERDPSRAGAGKRSKRVIKQTGSRVTPARGAITSHPLLAPVA